MGALLAALIAEIKLKDLSHVQTTVIKLASEVNNQRNLFIRTEATAGIVFATSGLVVVTSVAVLLERAFNSHSRVRIRVSYYYDF